MVSVSSRKTGPRFLIAHNHAIFAEALRVYLEKTYTVVGVVLDGRALVTEAMRLRPDAIIVNTGMPLLNGLDAARRIKQRAPTIKFIFVTIQDNPDLAAAALGLGPIGFVTKNSTGEELLKAIDHVLNGKPYVTSKLRPVNWFERKFRAPQFSKALTSRQKDIVQLLAEGRPIKEVAGLLDLSVSTVDFHKHQIQESFNLHSNAALVLFALRQGLIEVNPQIFSFNTVCGSR